MGVGQFIQPQINNHNRLKHQATDVIYPMPRRKRMISDFTDDNWILLIGSGISDDNVNFVYGTKSVKVTAVSGVTTMFKEVPNLKLENKFLVISFFLDSVANLNKIRIYLSTDTGAINNAYLIAKSTVKPGWNIMSIDCDVYTTTGNPTGLGNIKTIGIRVDANTSTTVNVSFDSIYYMDKLADRGKIVLTFDDAYESVYAIKPKMDKYGFCGVAYCPTSRIGNAGRLTLDQCKKLYQVGWDISSHSETHPISPAMTTYTQEQMDAELRNSYNYLIQNGFTRSARHYAHVGGATNDLLQSRVDKIYQTCRGSDTGPENIPLVTKNYVRNAIIIELTTTLEAAQAMVDRAESKKHIAVFMFHNIAETPVTAYEWSKTKYDALMDYIVTKNVDVVTMSELVMFEPNILDQRVQAGW